MKNLWKINESYRATVSDYAVFANEIEEIIKENNANRQLTRLYNLLFTTSKAFPEIIKFFTTNDASILRHSGLKFDQNDILHFRSLIDQNPQFISLANYIMARRYMSQDIWFFSYKDRRESVRYRETLFPAHLNYPDREWYGYALPDSCNIAEAVRLLEHAIVNMWTYFNNPVIMARMIKSGKLNSVSICSFFASCLKLDFLNVLPANTYEYAWLKQNKTFLDIVEDCLSMLESLRAWSSRIIIDGQDIRTLIYKWKTRRLLQIDTIQRNASTRWKGLDTQRLLSWAQWVIDGVNYQSQRIESANKREIIAALLKPTPLPPSASTHPQDPLSP